MCTQQPDQRTGVRESKDKRVKGLRCIMGESADKPVERLNQGHDQRQGGNPLS